MEESFLSADFISHKAIPFTDLSPFPHQFFLMISYMAESGPCMAMQMTKQAALTTHSASKVHFKPVVMGRQWNAQWEMPQTMAANGMPTRKRPAMHMTSVGSGDTQNAASAIMGKSDTKGSRFAHRIYLRQPSGMRPSHQQRRRQWEIHDFLPRCHSAGSR